MLCVISGQILLKKHSKKNGCIIFVLKITYVAKIKEKFVENLAEFTQNLLLKIVPILTNKVLQ